MELAAAAAAQRCQPSRQRRLAARQNGCLSLLSLVSRALPAGAPLTAEHRQRRPSGLSAAVAAKRAPKRGRREHCGGPKSGVSGLKQMRLAHRCDYCCVIIIIESSARAFERERDRPSACVTSGDSSRGGQSSVAGGARDQVSARARVVQPDRGEGAGQQLSAGELI